MMRILSIFALAFLTIFSSEAQNLPEPATYAGAPDNELVIKWLQSPDPRVQAWAAHDILVHDSTDLIPDLELLLEHTTPVTLTDAGRLANYRTTLAVLDTLIRLGATVPAATLGRIEKLGYNAQTEEVVLLSRLPWNEAEPVISTFYKPDPSTRPDITRVAAQLLAQHPPKGFAASFLSTILISVRISVHDPPGGIGYGIGMGSSYCCGGSGPTTNDWPEIGRYAFQDRRDKQKFFDENTTLFVAAPDPIYLVRTVSRTYSPTTCGGLAPLNDAIRSHIVGTMLGGNPISPFPEQPVSLNILFRSREAYRAEVQAFVDAYLDSFHQTISSLTATGVLTVEEQQAATLRMNLSLQDLRLQPADDLPTIAFRPPIQWVPAF